MTENVQFESANENEVSNGEAVPPMDRTYSRTMTEVESDEIREVR